MPRPGPEFDSVVAADRFRRITGLAPLEVPHNLEELDQRCQELRGDKRRDAAELWSKLVPLLREELVQALGSTQATALTNEASLLLGRKQIPTACNQIAADDKSLDL